mmetsp:Transcript_8009/g.20020  ORF Transcript_8009/g.20020 Transcript_8009/m.20020 type:complete len:212 (+) Transcript_8009:338-973(+)
MMNAPACAPHTLLHLHAQHGHVPWLHAARCTHTPPATKQKLAAPCTGSSSDVLPGVCGAWAVHSSGSCSSFQSHKPSKVMVACRAEVSLKESREGSSHIPYEQSTVKTRGGMSLWDERGPPPWTPKHPPPHNTPAQAASGQPRHSCCLQHSSTSKQTNPPFDQAKTAQAKTACTYSRARCCRRSCCHARCSHPFVRRLFLALAHKHSTITL